MIFPFATTFITVFALGQTALAALTPAQVIVNINTVTDISTSANSALVPLSPTTTPTQIRATATTLANNFNTIIQDLSAAVTAMKVTTPFTASQGALVVVTLKKFVTAHQTLLGTVIGKHTIFAQFGVTAAILAVLRDLETGVDAFALSLIDLIPTEKTTVDTDAGQLRGTLSTTIDVYKQICMPALLFWPTLQPICVKGLPL